MRGKTVRINLEVEPGAEPIQGSLWVQDETPQRFWGWLQLSTLLMGAAGHRHKTTARTTKDGRRAND